MPQDGTVARNEKILNFGGVFFGDLVARNGKISEFWELYFEEGLVTSNRKISEFGRRILNKVLLRETERLFF